MNTSTARARIIGMLSTAAALSLSQGVLAQASPYSIGASLTLGHDSNLYRTEFSPQPDKYAVAGLLAGFDQPIGRQRLYANGTVRATQYEDYRELDNTGYGLNAGLDWETIGQLSGSLNMTANQRLAQYGASVNQPTLRRKNVETSRQYSARVQLGMASTMSLEGTLAHRQIEYSASEFAASELTQNIGSVGLRYRPSDLLNLGVGLRATRGEYPNVVLAGGNNAILSRNDLDLTAQWVPTGLSTFNARLSFGRQVSNAVNQRDSSGVTGSISWAFLPTGKLSFNTALSRDTGTESGFAANVGLSGSGVGDNSVFTNSLAITANYAATAKIRLNAGLRYARRSLSNQLTVAGAPTQTLEGSDSLTSVSLGANYEPTRNWQLGCNAVRDSRSASGGLSSSYTATTANCAAQFTLK